jgi:hypothetical protein
MNGGGNTKDKSSSKGDQKQTGILKTTALTDVTKVI